MVIYDFCIFYTGFRPSETDAVFVVNSDGVLSLSVALELFEPIARWAAEVV
jgi:hypothetical protein